MKNYLLVHGAWGNAKEFDEVVTLLSANGNKVTAIDLPGHGESNESIADVTMDAYVQRVIETINDIDEKVILIGHSLGGAIISQVAEAIPENIDRLIYVAGMLPKTGDTPLELMQGDEGGELFAKIIFSDDQSYTTLTSDLVRNILLHDVTDKVRLERLIPEFLMEQSTQPFMASAQLSEEKFGSVEKYYIRASLDKVLSPSLQEKMLSNWDVEKVYTLESGHFPLTSMADRLVEVINKVSLLDEVVKEIN